MFRARERGMSFWPFAVSLVVLIVFVVLWFSVSGERDNALRERDAARAKEKETAESLDNLKKDFQQVSKAIGYTEGQMYSRLEVVRGRIKEVVGRWREKAAIEFTTSKYTVAEGGGVPDKAEGDKLKVSYFGVEGQGEPETLESVVPFVEQGIVRMRFDIERAFAAQAEIAAAKDAQAKAHEEALRAKDERIASLTSEKQAVEQQMAAQTQELRDQKAELERQKDQLQSGIEQVKRQQADETSKFLAQINEARGTIRTLVQRDAPALSEGPDGEVLIGADGMVVVNRGKRQFLMPGTIFKVFGRAKGGALYEKGQIKVTMCDDESARCTVLEQASGLDPIVRGDLVQSETYSPGRKLHFALVGEFKKMGRSMLEARLRQLGAEIDDKVTAETHFLVVGTPGAGEENLEESDAVRTAKDLGTRMITEDQLASFTQI